ncbi:aromatic ring-hydroxylating dioxygenase subunit alpha [Rhodococcus sp. IEGM 1381]|uniref:aromatic ring-hydroxylating oxygenase subunit alpha n=1 Tax=Rhodococcus sp. IEGM 1381 TaxID=3047085 RepID=UPI0024B8011A|nr:aromatic ring-hydroxylating dioxygenase subunit alpha [Rhodococcus sp. IEGM 1381]MDI9897379.1 aromatic ring-hydroxylating dioxygenase subunit alpha [Rhodococcus sp. IEGM 1381]
MPETVNASSSLPFDRVVDSSVYYDAATYEKEVSDIFGQSWLLACHESELTEPGDFVTTTLAGAPVIIARDKNRDLRAYLNVCRHRACKVVSEDAGHASAFRCPYHFWVYSLEGELVGLSGAKSYEGTGFEKSDHNLIEFTCESTLGLVFVHFGKAPTSVVEWLGPTVHSTMATPLANAEFTVISRWSMEMPVNWKVFAENVRDGYHVPFVHPFFRAASPAGRYSLHDNGHAVQQLGMDPEGMEPELWEQLRKNPLPGVEVGDGYIVNLFPDSTVTLRSNVVSIDTQHVLSPDKVVLHNLTLGLVGDDDEVMENRKLAQKTWFQNPLEIEDYPIFLAQQEGLTSRKLPYSVIARGQDASEGERGDDNRLRQFWSQWRLLMGTKFNSLSDVQPGSVDA